MTDAPITNQDLQMTLAQIEETLAKAADPAALFDGAKAHLGALYNNAETAGNNDAMVAINESWNYVQSFASAAQQNRESYLIAKDIAHTFETQRDDALGELETLSHAVDYMDTDHPKVAELLESFQEAIDEEEAYWFDDGMENQIFERFQDILHMDDAYEPHMEIFLEIWRNNIEVSPARQREFYAWLDAVQADNTVDDDEDGEDDE